QELAPLGPCTVSAVSERVDQSGVSDVDLLFVIDNSGSMASEQLKLAQQLPNLVTVLTSGDRFPGVADEDLPAGATPENRKFTPVKTLHLGVVSTNAGGIDEVPANQQQAIQSCAGEGDDGQLQNSTAVAVDGVYAMSRNEFVGYDAGQEVLAPRPNCDISGLPKYQVFEAGEDEAATTALAFGCVAALGVRGCPFEQQLESMWKALAPSQGIGNSNLFKFINGSKGQGDRYNQDFLRDEAILAVIIVSDEEDCSITDEGKVLFSLTEEAEEEFGLLNLRCGIYANEESYVQPVQRYVDGLKSLKPDNQDRIIFATIVGVPEDAVGMPIEDILALPEMQFSENPMAAGFPSTSCVSSKGDQAYPPSRMLRVAAEFGEQAVIYSICADDYSPALDTLIDKIASKLKGNCLPRVLTPGDEGLVNCEVFELLPANDDESCPEEFGLEGDPIDRNINEMGKTVQRKACKMKQLAVTGNNEIAAGNGWYYDNFSENLKDDCNPGEQQRISFRFEGGNTSLPSGAGATFECFQPVARIDNLAKGFDAVNTRCATSGNADDSICAEKEGADGYQLFCQPDALTCQIQCAANPDCPPGWVCAAPLSGDGQEKYCQLPTCPQDTAPTGS
ncbi:MAG: hypothetical protein ABW352_16270, partial [Polyangiales bacterium]